MKKFRRLILAALALPVVLASSVLGSQERPMAEERAPTAGREAKTATVAGRLLLPRYLVDTSDFQGTTTLFAVRNERDVPVEIDLNYFRPNSPQAPQRSDRVVLGPKEIRSTNLRGVADLQVDADGFARGYVIVEALTAGAAIQGDYFQLTPNEDFASGFRLLDVDPQSFHNHLCSLFTMRFLNGGGFDSGTSFVVWLDREQAPDPTQPVLTYAVYGEQGGDPLLVNELFADEVVFEVSAEALLRPVVQEDFGAIEFQFSGSLGHISAVLSAGGRYSVGLEAMCGDP